MLQVNITKEEFDEAIKNRDFKVGFDKFRVENACR